jgi:hypothetical protein
MLGGMLGERSGNARETLGKRSGNIQGMLGKSSGHGQGMLGAVQRILERRSGNARGRKSRTPYKEVNVNYIS